MGLTIYESWEGIINDSETIKIVVHKLNLTHDDIVSGYFDRVISLYEFGVKHDGF